MTFKVSGMACVHCRNRVADAVSKVCGVESADVDLGRPRSQFPAIWTPMP